MNIEDTVAQHRIRLMMTASFFDLSTREGRKVSHHKLRDFFVDLQRVVDPDICLEIGASEARFSRTVRGVLRKEARVFAFEANPYAFAKMSALHDYENKHRVFYKNMAISDVDGTAEFQIQKSRGEKELAPELGDNSLLKRARDDVQYETAVVESSTLDSFLSGADTATGTVTAWIDVEGAAKLVLGGAKNSMSRIQAIMIEMEDDRRWAEQWTAPELFAHLIGLGFIPVAQDFEYAQQYNVVFIKSKVSYHSLFGQVISKYYNSLRAL